MGVSVYVVYICVSMSMWVDVCVCIVFVDPIHVCMYMWVCMLGMGMISTSGELVTVVKSLDHKCAVSHGQRSGSLPNILILEYSPIWIVPVASSLVSDIGVTAEKFCFALLLLPLSANSSIFSLVGRKSLQPSPGLGNLCTHDLEGW